MLIPIGHEARVQRFPYVTVGLMILSLIVFVPSYYLELDYREKIDNVRREIHSIDPFYFQREEMEKDPRLEQVKEMFGGEKFELSEEKKQRLSRLEEKLERLKNNRPFYKWGSVPKNFNPVTAVTCVFLHAGWAHLIGNMLFLWLVGCNIEDRWGPWFFGAFYIAGGFVASGTHTLANMGSDIPTIGASGAVAAVMGAFLIRYWKTKIRFFYFFWTFVYFLRGTFKVPAYVVLPFWFLKELFWGTSGVVTGVAHWAHIGGFVFGLAGGLFLWLSGIEDKYFVPKYSLDGEEHEVPEEYVQAREALAAGDREGAKQKFLMTVSRHNGYLPALVNLSKLYAEEKNRQELVKTTEAIVRKTLSTDEPHLAVENFQRMMNTFPDASLSPASQFRMASTLASSGLYQEASWSYRNLAAAYPNEILAQKSLVASGDLLTDKLKMHKNAVAMYEHLLKYYPDTALAEKAKEGLARARKAMEESAT